MFLLGDTANHPVLLVEDGWTNVLDDNFAAAADSRRRLADSIRTAGAIAIGAHFPAVEGGRINGSDSVTRVWAPIIE